LIELYMVVPHLGKHVNRKFNNPAVDI